jgi:lipopolysaccharide transport system permease protein
MQNLLAGIKLSPFAMLLAPFTHRYLLWYLLKKDIEERYKGSVFGVVWAVLNAIMMLAIYTFVFAFVFKAKWVSADQSVSDFALIFYIGLVMQMFLSEVMSRAPHLMLQHRAYVTKIAFPLDILGYVITGNSLFHLVVNFGVWCSLLLMLQGSLPISLLLAPLVFLPVVFFALGFAWLFSAVGVFIKDVSHLTGFLSMIRLFLCPIFYPLTMIPEAYRGFLYLNPLTVPVEFARAAFVFDSQLNWHYFGASMICSIVFAYIGYFSFQRSRSNFADVL